MPVSLQTFQSIALEDPERNWELFQGRLREKPAMSVPHNRTMARLAHQLSTQLDIDRFEVRSNAGRLSYLDETYFIPDVYVVPVALISGVLAAGDELLEVIRAPLPFVAEIWSPSTGAYDVDRKIPEYQQRGDVEIWRIHPYELTVTTLTRAADGEYDRRLVRAGRITVSSLPAVVIDIDALFAFRQ